MGFNDNFIEYIPINTKCFLRLMQWLLQSQIVTTVKQRPASLEPRWVTTRVFSDAAMPFTHTQN